MSPLPPAPLLLILAACAPREPDRPVDADGDHWVASHDCDDADPDRHPDAPERCNGLDDDCDGLVDEDPAIDAPTWYADADGDGYGAAPYAWTTCARPSGYVDNAEDCDDADPAVSPEGVEACNGVDDDCDGEVDEAGATGAGTWYGDADGDGYGNPEVRVEGCEAESGYVDNAEDCDDTRADVNPDAPEVCDAWDADEDCDGLADDADEGALGPSEWWPDADGDGHGDATGTPAEACDPPEGYAAEADDCDDADRDVNPEAVEVCGDGVDQDCDGLVDADDPDAEPVDWYADADGDGYPDPDGWLARACEGPGGAVAAGADWDCDDADPAVHPGAVDAWYDGVDSDCDGADDDDADGDGHAAESAGGDDCDDADARVHPGAVELCDDGLDDDCDGVTDPCAVAAALAGLADGDEAGGALAVVGDVDGDGYADLLVGADREDTAGAGAGAAYLVLGPLSGEGDLGLAAALLTGEAAGDHAGVAVAGGDVDGDGYADLVVGAYDEGTAATAAGAAYVVGGPVTGTLSLRAATARLYGEAADHLAGSSVAVGDVDGDGAADLLVGGPGEDTNGAAAGGAWLVLGPATGSARLWSADARLRGEAAGDQAGSAVAVVGDTDGDGLADLAVGAPYEHGSGSWTGAVYLVLGTPRGTMDLSLADAKWTGRGAGGLAGSALAGGDVDGDGYADLLVGAPGDDAGGTGAGAAFLLRGPLSAAGSLADAAAILVGENGDDAAGSAVALPGDLDGDGTSDLALGARLEDSALSDGGAVYLVLGPASGTLDLSAASAKLQAAGAGDHLGAALAAGDLDGDGWPDLAAGAPDHDPTGLADAGLVWLLPGGW